MPTPPPSDEAAEDFGKLAELWPMLPKEVRKTLVSVAVLAAKP